MSTKKIAVIVAGGSGTRMGTDIPKQFLELDEKPVLMRTLERFSWCDEVIVVLPKNEIEAWNILVSKHGFRMDHKVIEGGNTRFQSVRNGLLNRSMDGVVAVHDGVRPIVSEGFVRRCFDAAEQNGTSIPSLAIPDSIREASNGEYRIVDRSRFILVQTPQCFLTEYIAPAYLSQEDKGFTDDASVLESAGIPLHFIPGERWNIKITYRDDLDVARLLFDTISKK